MKQQFVKSAVKKATYIGALIGATLLFSFLLSSTAYAATQGTVTGERVNVRAYAEINDTNRLFQVTRGESIEILGTDGDFFRANINGSQNVYIAREWVGVTQTYGLILNPIINIYNLPTNHGGQVIASVDDYHILTVNAYYENWFAIDFNGEQAFVYRADVTIPYFAALSTARIPGLTNSLGEEIVAFAKNYIGTRYVWGGMTPAGFDCSGFMNYILNNFGISINRVSRDIARNGVAVSRNELQPADLVFFSANPGSSHITHVGMYIGGGQFIHSSTWNSGVIISSMTSAYNNPRFVTARRVI